MNRHKHQTPKACWPLAVVLPVLVASLTWLWLEIASGSSCSTGPDSPNLPALGILVLTVPASIGWYANYGTGSVTSGWMPMLLGTVTAVPLVLFALLAWAGAHNCFG